MFLFLGRHLLQWLNLRPESVNVGGGIVFFLISQKNDFLPYIRGIMGHFPAGEPLLVPLAVLLLAGPSTLAMLILLSSSAPVRWLLAVVLSWSLTSCVMLYADGMHRWLGEKGLLAVKRLMGLVHVALEVQMLLDGISENLRHSLPA